MAEKGGDFEGSARLLRNLLRLVDFGTVSLDANLTLDVLVDEIPELQHAFYLYDVYHTPEPGGSSVDVIQHGPGITISGGVPGHMGGVCVSMFKRRKTGVGGATQLQTWLHFSNQIGGLVELQYEVYRLAGLT